MLRYKQNKQAHPKTKKKQQLNFLFLYVNKIWLAVVQV